MTITELLAPIEERLAAATPGPWYAECGVSTRSAWAFSNRDVDVLRLNSSENIELDESTNRVEENIELIENCPTDLAKLIAALKRADEALEKICEHRSFDQNLYDTVGLESPATFAAKQACADITAILKGDGR